MRVSSLSAPRAQTEPPPTVRSPPSPNTPAFTDVVEPVAGSIRVTVPSSWLRIQTAPSPTPRNRGACPALTVRTTCLVAGSICSTTFCAGLPTHTDPSPTRTVAAPSLTTTRSVTRSVRGSTRATLQPVHPGPSVTSHTAPSPAPTLPSPPSSTGIGRRTYPTTELLAGSILANPGFLHVAVQTKPNPTSVASHGPCGTRIVAFRRPLTGSSR